MTSVQALPVQHQPSQLDTFPFPHSSSSSSSSDGSMTLNREFVNSLTQTVDHPSVPTAFEHDAHYTSIYTEFAATGSVPQLLLDRERLGMMLHFLSSGHAHPPEEDYADSFVAVNVKQGRLMIKHWLISHPTLTLNLEDIIYILPAAYVVPKSGISPWGVGSTGVAWARDPQRLEQPTQSTQRSYVCKFKSSGDGGEFYAGFTVEQPEKFVGVLENAWHGD